MAKQQDANTPAPYSRGPVTSNAPVERVPFAVSPERPFQAGYLADVRAERIPAKEEDGTENICISFLFKEENGPSEYLHREFAVTEEFTDAAGRVHSVEEQYGWQDRVISQLYNVFMGENAHVDAALGAGATDDFDFFAKVAEKFNTGRGGNRVYQDGNKHVSLWLKLVYNNAGYVGFPKFGNFIDRRVEGRATLLRVNKGDNFTPPVNAAKANIPSGSNAGAPPSSMPAGFGY